MSNQSEQNPENPDHPETTSMAEQSYETPAAPVRSRWRDHTFGIRSVAAVAVAGLIIGGGAGAAIHAATDDDRGRDGRMGFHRGPGGFGGPGDGRMQQPPGPGQLPPPNGFPAPPEGVPGQNDPTTPPSDSVDPEDGATTPSGDTT